MTAGPRLFLSWAPFSRRTQTLAAAFGLEVRFLPTPWPKRPLTTPLKYPWQAAATAAEVYRRRPAELWVMDPPTPLVVIGGLYAWRAGVPLVVDMHTVAFTAPEWRLLRPAELPFLRRAAAVVVSNDELAAQVESWGCRAVVLPDAVPTAPAPEAAAVEPGLVTVVATYSADEPLHLLPGVAARLPDVRFAVTGAPRGDLRAWPANLRPTGFLDEHAYWALLRRSAAVMVLTTRPATLLSGGYEALAVGRPLVTSDHAALRGYFGDAALYAAAGEASLAEAVRAALDDAPRRAARLHALRDVRRTQWRQAADRLATTVRAAA
jgi:glycosyltransferase involved in cell wall biosynthesis